MTDTISSYKTIVMIRDKDEMQEGNMFCCAILIFPCLLNSARKSIQIEGRIAAADQQRVQKAVFSLDVKAKTSD